MKKLISIIMCIFVVMCYMPSTALAYVAPASSNKAIQLDATAIADPTLETSGSNKTYYTPNSYIYYGVNSGNESTPIKWRVLDADKANDGTTNGMFLMSEYTLASNVAFSTKRKNVYQGSNAQTWCKNFASNGNNFSSTEQGAMFGVAKSDKSGNAYGTDWAYTDDITGSGKLMTSDKLFCMSVWELQDYVGNYNNAKGLAATDTSENKHVWYLRTSYYEKNTNVGGVTVNGSVTAIGVSASTGSVRPAFNLDSSKILFTSAAEGGKSATGMDSGLTSVSAYTGNEWKLTLWDNERNFSVSTNSVSALTTGGNVAIEYTNAKVGTADAPEYVSAMITDNTGNVLYYGRLKNITSEDEQNGTLTVALPAGLEAGNYTLKVFNEQYNGDKKTDCASLIANVSLTLTAPAYVAKVNEQNYTSLSDAMTAAGENGTVEILCDTAVADGTTLNIPAGVTLTVPADKSLSVSGTGKIVVKNGGKLEVNGTLELAGDNADQLTIENSGKLVKNTDAVLTVAEGKTWTVSGGTFSFSPVSYVAEGYNVYKVSDTEYVVATTAPANITGYNTWKLNDGIYEQAYVPHSSGSSSSSSSSASTTGNVTNKTETSSTSGETQKVTNADIKSTTTTTSGNKTTSATVDATTADKIVEKAVSNESKEVVVDAASSKTVTESEVGATTEVALPEKTVKEISEKTDASIVIKTDAAEATLDKAAVDAVSEQAGTTGQVKLVVETVEKNDSKIQVELKLETSNGTVKDFKGGNVNITVKLSSALAAKELVCVYIDDNSAYHRVAGEKNADGTYTFTTGHFSSYAIMAEEEADTVIAKQEASAKDFVAKLSLKARSTKTAKGNIKVKLTVDEDDIEAIENLGYTVKYKYYRSTSKSKGYAAKIEGKGKTYTNTTGKKGTRYYYKARVMVYDSEETLIAKTELKQCKYASRIK